MRPIELFFFLIESSSNGHLCLSTYFLFQLPILREKCITFYRYLHVFPFFAVVVDVFVAERTIVIYRLRDSDLDELKLTFSGI